MLVTLKVRVPVDLVAVELMAMTPLVEVLPEVEPLTRPDQLP